LNGPKSNGHDLELPSASGASTKQGGLVCFGVVCSFASPVVQRLDC
jgi:hypothetical protein